MSLITFKQVQTASSGGASVTSLQLFITPIVVGSLIFVYPANNSPSSVTTTGPPLILLAGPEFGQYTQLYYFISTSLAAITIQANYSSSQQFCAIAAVEYSGNTPSPIDHIANNTIGTGILTLPTQNVIASGTNETMIEISNAYGSSSNYTSTTGQIIRLNNFAAGVSVADRAVSTRGVYSDSGTITNNPFGNAISYMSVASTSSIFPSGTNIPVARPGYGVGRINVSSNVR